MRIDGRIEQQEERHRAQEYTHRRTRADQGNGSKLKHLNGSKLEPDTMSQYINIQCHTIQCHTTCYPI